MEVERKGKATAQREERNARENENTNPETTRNPSTEVIYLVGNLIEENEKKEFILIRSTTTAKRVNVSKRKPNPIPLNLKPQIRIQILLKPKLKP